MSIERRVWARVEYDGTDFYGFQVQARERTVQGEIERAIRAVTGHAARVVGAGRTDRGVHAQGQVIAFTANWKHGLPALQGALNATLAPDVAILALGPAAEEFHPRFSARSRTYRYSVANRPCRLALERRHAWHVATRLDHDRMSAAGRCLVGKKDFSTFGRPLHGDNTLRTVFRAEWECPAGTGRSQEGKLLVFEIEADAFLYRMVRSVVGTLVRVGLGELTAQEFEGLLRARDRSQIRLVAPAQGLCLARVDYDATFQGVVQ
ncbi:MAG TPA: tRNA pseudouridine(38-40) synthase TruA [Anaerolineae bacterium]|nr:tRNA pseudouridine(38-40) synthase TruA [Anaerolineae bacterium]HNS52463.1 tRNA pseudouridine(38-40) synthase TruA [Anaerolineae bacterium]